MNVLLTGGTVIDGTGAPARVADLLIRDGRIATGPADGVPRRDVSGKIVAPGFVDIHSHSDLTLLSDPRGLSKVHQGVTTEVVGNCGLGVGGPADRVRQYVGYLDLDPSVRWTWSDLPGYLSALADAGPGLNVGVLTGHVAVRATGALAADLDAGALGLSTGLVYPPLVDASEEELTALAAVVAGAGRVFAWHLRNYDDDLLPSVAQAVRVGRETGCRIQISHLTAVGRRNWGSVRRALTLIDGDTGVDIYPYLYGNAPLSQLLTSRDSWGERDWSEITISWTGVPRPEVGRTVADLAAEQHRDGAEVVGDLLADLGERVIMTAGGRSEDDLRAVLAHPATVVASDGLALDPDGVTGAGLPHPRSYGCFPRYLRGGITPEAIRRCTSAPAARVGLTDRGVLRPGAAADVVVIDPSTLADRATFTAPHAFATGIDLVLVNGVPVIDGGVHTGARAGKVLTA